MAGAQVAASEEKFIDIGAALGESSTYKKNNHQITKKNSDVCSVKVHYR